MPVILIAGLLCSQAQATAAPRILVSIAPLAHLVAGVTAGVTVPEVLVPAHASPHHFQLKPSQALALRQADIVIWVGPALEQFLSHYLSHANNRHQKILPLMTLPNLPLLKMRELNHWPLEHAELLDDEHHHHEHGQTDPHIWLDPVLASKLVTEIANMLSDYDSNHRKQYQANAKQVSAELLALNQQLHDRLKAVQDGPYLVVHDAYQYFEHRYQLNPQGTLLGAHANHLSVKHLKLLFDGIEHSGSRCLFDETQNKSKLVAAIQQHYPVRIGQLDPLGQADSPSIDNYYQLLNNLAYQYTACLDNSADSAKSKE